MKTTIYLPDLLYEKAKDAGLNFSRIAREAVEVALYGDNPEYLDKLYEREKEELRQHENKVKQLDQKRKKARELQKKRKERLKQYQPEMNDYRTIIPSKKNQEGD